MFTCAPPRAALGILGAGAEGTLSPLALPRPLPHVPSPEDMR